ncbi:BatD family protein [Sanyastnella coralliicola]|uniref:BatD family protein n=1 Tax=Sanyastnella coralliicola TaxID=3069118 RepID=UPI0027B97416|nr:BatD family protein [Longitalea sp. SCSIO 12813]
MAKRRRSRRTGSLILFLVAFFISGAIQGQDVSVSASVSKNPVAPREAFKLTVTITNSDGQIKLPAVDGLQLLYGPSTGQSVRIDNGRKTSETSYTYTFRANVEGKMEIPAIPVRTSAGVLKTRPFTLSVSKNSDSSISQNFVTVIEASKKKVYLGEPVVIKYKVYQRYNSFNIESYDLPEFDGFWVENVGDHQGRWENLIINGQRYSVATIKIDVIFPQRTGDFTLFGFNMSGVVGGFFNRQRVESTSQSVNIEVLPLPEGKPANFLGSFPSLSIRRTYSALDMKANQALDMGVEFSGKGALRLIQEPKTDWPSDMEVFDPEVRDRISTTASGVSGKRTYSYVVIPRTEGNYEIPGLDFSYFNTIKKQYEKINLEAITLKVSPSEAGSDVPYSFNAKSDVQILNKDIRYIRSDAGKLTRPANIFFGSLPFYLSYGAPFLIFIGAIAYRRKKINEAGDVEGTRRKKAKRSAKKWLSEASKGRDNSNVFYSALARGMEQYVMDKFTIDRSRLNERSMNDIVRSATDEETAERFMKVWKTCQQARFAPVSQMSKNDLLDEANQLIDKIESQS